MKLTAQKYLFIYFDVFLRDLMILKVVLKILPTIFTWNNRFKNIFC